MTAVAYSDAFKKISDQHDDALCKARQKTAKLVLAHYRKLLKRYNYSRHVISIEGGMGMYGVYIDGECINWKPGGDKMAKRSDAYALLVEIGDSLDSEWDYHLAGERLN